MPLTLPDKLPAIELLKQENIFVIDNSRAVHQDIRPLRIVILNLMPLKITTETDLVRLLSNTPLQLEIHLMKVKAHTSKNTPVEHMRSFYRDFEQMRNEKFDGMIITGAPVEHLDYREVSYWDEMTEIFSWARTHVTSTMYICWAAQAGLYYHYGIRKKMLDSKMFGVYEHRVRRVSNPLLRGFDEVFYAPHSRHTEIVKEDVNNCSALRVLADSKEAGYFLLGTDSGRQIFVMGHPEYDRDTLDKEYKRDLSKGLDIAIPVNYYEDDDPNKEPIFRWRAHAHLLYHNWMNYYVYQDTPYDLDELEEIK